MIRGGGPFDVGIESALFWSYLLHVFRESAIPCSLARIRLAWPRLLGASARSSAATRPPRRVYFFSAGALDGDFAIDVVGTIMWAYGVPFHITHGPPLVQSVGYASS